MAEWAQLDSILELYNRAGKPLAEALSVLVPPAWENGRISEADETKVRHYVFIRSTNLSSSNESKSAVYLSIYHR